MRAAIGIDVGGTKVLGVVLTAVGEVAAEQRLPTPGGTDDLVTGVVSLVDALEGADSAGPGPLPVGIGAPGLVDRSGSVRFAPNLPGINGAELRARAERALGPRPVVVDNDANCAGWGEARLGAAQHARHALMVTLGTGIGGGVVADGRLLRGADGFAGEIGHMVVDPSGPLCPCGRAGCWERYASGSGLGRLAREAAHGGVGARLIELAGGDPEAVRGEHVTAAAAEGDPGALAVIDRFAWWLGMGLANLANAFDPEIFVIGGGLIEAGDLLLEPTRRELGLLIEAGAVRPEVKVVAAALGERAGAIGAALLALEPAVTPANGPGGPGTRR
ncbi:MAG TPA: ROK family protein [Acidimicrobiales bacterium]|nr:ROK family protein [Acidimicrobiales bacterium]